MHERSATKRLRRPWWLLAGVLVTLAASACGSSNSGNGNSAGGASGSLAAQVSDPGNASKQIDIFIPPTSDPYAATWLRYATHEASSNGYSVHVIQTPDPSTAASQVQQLAAGGNRPAAFIWWPIDPSAQLGSLAQLSRTRVPIFQANQLPVKGSAPYLTAYSGVSDTVVGQEDGKAAIAACAALKKLGTVKGGSDCNAIVTALPPGYGATVDRLAGFKQTIAGSDVKIIAVANTTGFTAQNAFTTTAQLISANRAQGIDIDYAEEDDFAIGAIQALSQAGYKPAKNVEVVGGSCHGNASDLMNGTQFSTVIQGAGLEGRFAMQTVLQYLKTGKVADGTYQAPATPNAEPSIPATISRMNLIPVPFVTQEQFVKGTKLWGESGSSWCTY
jgi:ABC-type sugar transport system substrate-binding protein